MAEAPTSMTVAPDSMPAIGTVDERFQSYNVEMVEITGGKWWGSYPSSGSQRSPLPDKSADQAAGIDASGFRFRPPVDLTNPRLRKLAAALGPAYLRVSDTWANTMFFQNSNAKQASLPPDGFKDVLTGPEWKGVLDFSKAVNAKIVTSFSIGPGTRDADGVWKPTEAEKFLSFTRAAGGNIAAAEFFNEPNIIGISGAPKGYDAAAYGRDFKIFRAFAKKADPQMKIVGPGSVGEGEPLRNMPAQIKTADMLAAEGSGLDAISYHFYGAVSERCKALGPEFQTSSKQALTAAWLTTTAHPAAFYSALRDRYEPDKPVWLTETADAACGGNPWAADFIDSFRYLNQLGILAKQGVKVVMHNTLNASDYGLIDERTLEPRPDYWSAVFWRRLMGTTVLDAADFRKPNLYVYAHCMRGRPGGVTVLAINADQRQTQSITTPTAVLRYTLTSANLLGPQIELNGKILRPKADGSLPALAGRAVPAGPIALIPASITFIAMPAANNKSCEKA
jgi:heparanase 1